MLNIRFLCLFLLFNSAISCIPKKHIETKLEDKSNTISEEPLGINTIVNEQYIKSRKSYSGRISLSDYQELKNEIERELKTEIPDGKSIFLNYVQKANNCLLESFDETSVLQITKNKFLLSDDISKKYNAMDFFIYTDNTYLSHLYENQEKFSLDLGYFYNNIFTVHENCGAFFILKPNGEWMKYFGEDYYSDAKKFLRKKIKK